MSRLSPLPIDQHAELAQRFAFFEKTLGFVPNSLLTMQRKPKLVDAFIQFSAWARNRWPRRGPAFHTTAGKPGNI